MRKKIFLTFLLSLILVPLCIFAQPTKIRGKVIDKKTREPLPFATIVFKGTSVGCITDFDGNYFLQERTNIDTIVVACVGYESQNQGVKRSVYQELNFELEAAEFMIEAVVVKPGENPAHRIIRNIIKHKSRNNPDKFQTYQYEVYNKMELDVNNVDSSLKKKPIFREFKFIFNYVDTSAETGKSFLPVLISESLSDYYYQKSPYHEKEIIKATNVSGIQDESLLQFSGQMYLRVNIYENFISLFGKQFISPISDFGLLSYRYYLLDSSFVEGKWCRHLSFKPRRKQELNFTGEMWVHDSTFAIKKIQARIADDANINYVNDLILTYEYSPVNDTSWFPEKEEIFVDFNLTDNTMGFFGRKTTTYKNVILGKKFPDNFFDPTISQQTLVQEDSNAKDSAFWGQSRHENLSQKEKNIYAMVDSIKDVPMFNTIVDIISLFVGGHYKMCKYFEYGPVFKSYSYNPVEKHRFRIGGRTTTDFSKKMRFKAHLAYGTGDKEFKYGGSSQFYFKRFPRMTAGISYMHDMEQLGLSANGFLPDNILSTLLSRRPNDKMLLVDLTKTYYEKEWIRGFSNMLTLTHRTVYPSKFLPFQNENTGEKWKAITSSEVTFNTRIGIKEKFVEGDFERVQLTSRCVVINLDVTKGMKNILGSNYDYFRLYANWVQNIDIPPLGRLNYMIDAGKIWGTLPFPLLKLHEGNETFAFDNYAFNLMNYYEFASDEYASLYVEHHFEGLFLNKVPLFRFLKLREVIYGKALIGNLSEKNNNEIMQFPSNFYNVREPYYEAGFGIENILKLFRVDFIWRISHRDNPDIQKFGVFAKVQVVF